MDRLYFVPTEGCTVRDPERDYAIVPPAGKFVPRNTYWLRRIKHGDGAETKPPKPEKPAKATRSADTPKKED